MGTDDKTRLYPFGLVVRHTVTKDGIAAYGILPPAAAIRGIASMV